MTRPDWIRVALEVDADEEPLAEALFAAAGVEGLEIIEATPGRLWLRAYLTPEEADALEVDLAPLRAPAWQPPHPVSRADFDPGLTPVEAPPFLILPHPGPGPSSGPEAPLIPLHLAPGVGFGGGEHPTTRLCLQALPAVIRQGAAALDVGSGTGALAIGAALLGADPVHAVDTAADARRATAENAAQNGVAVAVLGPELGAADATYPAVLANLLAPTLMALAEALVARTAPGGRLLLSGLIADDVARVAARFAALGATLAEAPRTEDGWAALILTRAP